MRISSNTPVSAESINAMLDEIMSDEHKDSRAQAEQAHVAEQAHLSQRVEHMREQAKMTMIAGMVSAGSGVLGAAMTVDGAASSMRVEDNQRASTVAQMGDAQGRLLTSAGGFVAAGFQGAAARAGAQGEDEQRMASDSAHASRMALDRAGELRQMRDRVTNMVDRNEETRHTTNMLFRA